MAVKLVARRKKHRMETFLIVVFSFVLVFSVFGIVTTQAMITTESKALQDTTAEVNRLTSINNNLNRERDQKVDLASVSVIARAQGLETRIESVARLVREKE